MKRVEGLKFGDLVRVRNRLLVISDDKLKELKETYGLCLSEKQMQDISHDAFLNELDDEHLEILNKDLVTKSTREYTYLITKKNLFGYKGLRYSEHNKYENYFGSEDSLITHQDSPNIFIDKAGKDFDSFAVWTQLEIVEVIDDKSLLNCDFFSNLNKN